MADKSKEIKHMIDDIFASAEGFLSTGHEAFIDTDWLTDDKVATVQKRNCEVCKHHVPLKPGSDIFGCEKAECEFEERRPKNVNAT